MQNVLKCKNTIEVLGYFFAECVDEELGGQHSLDISAIFPNVYIVLLRRTSSSHLRFGAQCTQCYNHNCSRRFVFLPLLIVSFVFSSGFISEKHTKYPDIRALVIRPLQIVYVCLSNFDFENTCREISLITETCKGSRKKKVPPLMARPLRP